MPLDVLSPPLCLSYNVDKFPIRTITTTKLWTRQNIATDPEKLIALISNFINSTKGN